MRTLIWKEWREQRLFFFLAVGLIILSKIVPSLIPRHPSITLDIKLYKLYMSYFVLPLLFSLLLGAISFTNEFARNTKSFLLTQPVSTARLFWVKYLSGLIVLAALILFTHLIFGIHYREFDFSDTKNMWPAFYLFFPILYSAGCFSSMLLKNTLPAIICTPFLLLFGFLLILPLVVVLFLVNPCMATFILSVFSIIIASFLIFSFTTWQKAITRDGPAIKTVLAIAGLILLFSLASHTTANLVTGYALNKTIRQAKAEGIKLTPEEVIPPPVPDKDNAALVYQQAFDLAERLKKKYRTEWEYMPYEGKTKIEELTVTQKKNISRIMQDPEFIKLYALIEKAVNMPACRFDINYEDGPSMLLPHLAKIRSLARLAAAKTFILSWERDNAKAWQYAEICFHISDSIVNEPILISGLVCIATDKIAIDSFQELLNGPIINTEKYNVIIREIDNKNRHMTNVLEGELAVFGYWIFKHYNYDGLSSFVSQYRPYRPSRTMMAFLGKPLMKTDYAFYIQAFIRYINYSKNPYFEIKDKCAEWERNISFPDRYAGMSHIISSMLMPSFGRVLVQQAMYNANLDTFKLALALKIYKEKHGNYPDSLTSLAPEIIPEIPLDPFTGKDYIYRREDKGFMVYSFGPDEKDNKGIYDSKKRQDDISFKVKN